MWAAQEPVETAVDAARRPSAPNEAVSPPTGGAPHSAEPADAPSSSARAAVAWVLRSGRSTLLTTCP